MKSKSIVILITLAILLFTISAATAGEQKKVILIVADYLKFNDFYLSSPLRKLAQQADIGLLNPNTGTPTIPHTYATLNAGRTVNAPPTGVQIYNGNEKIDNIPVSDVFSSQTGYNVPSEGVLLLSLPQLLQQNKDNKSDLLVGHLGVQIKSAGLTTAVLGNADLPNLEDRTAALIGINNLGYIPLGDVSNNLNKQTNDFLGLRTDYVKMLAAFDEVYERANFIIINLGDLVRLERSQRQALPHRVLSERQKILSEMTDFILEIKKRIEPGNDIILAGSLSQNPQNALGENRLLPFLLFGDQSGTSILSSSTTKRPGIITGIDITATILDHFNLPYNVTIGRPLISSSSPEDPVNYLAALNKRVSFVYDARNPLVKTYVFLQIVTILGAIPILFFLPKMAKVMKLILLAFVCYPLSLLLLGAVETESLILYALFSIVFTTLIVFASTKVTNNWLVSFMIIEALTALVILLDLATGANLAKFSPLSYQVITGARYYGIGNEYMGVLIGAIIVSCSMFYHLFPNQLTKYLVISCLLFTVLFIALPQLGINFGGTVAAIIAFGFTIFSWQGTKISVSRTVQLCALCLICVGIVVFYDLNQNIAAQSHLSRTVLLIKEQGLIELWSIMARKVAMNIKLFRYTIWSRVFLTTLFASILLLFRPVSIFNTLKLEYPKLFTGFFGTIVGSVVALICNDSGIVASATMMIYSALPIIYFAFHDRLKNLHKA